MTVGILALQGAFIEHEKAFDRLGASCIELRNSSDLEMPFDALVLPGGESTVQGRLLKSTGMYDAIRARIEGGMPVLATCAGLILLAEHIEGEDTVHLGTLPVTVRRNAYGRQLGSFHTISYMEGYGPLPMTFIRAPYITEAAPGVQVLARLDNKIVAVRHGRQLALAFHPELDNDLSIHRSFLELIQAPL